MVKKNISICASLLFFSILLLGALASCRLIDSGPRARYGAGLIYDPDGDQMILFGGRAKGLMGEKVLNDTWLLNLENTTWTKLKTSSNPPPRLSPGLIFDPESRQLILFGGLGRKDRFGDTWILDLEDGSWQEVFPATSPSPRSDMGMTFDEESRLCLLFGGYCQENERGTCSDTWIYQMDSGEWVEVITTSGPPITYGLQMVFDTSNSQHLQWGGHMSGFEGGGFKSLGYSDTLWSFTRAEADWEIIEPVGGSSPQPRYWHHLVYVPDLKGVVLFGGDGGRGFLNDTWLYRIDRNTWERIPSNESPAPRINAAVAYDPHRDRLVLFGGVGENFTVFKDTWILSPSTGGWEQKSP